jgi:photosystem II stability/assembly factor-like uncharacterized protein
MKKQLHTKVVPRLLLILLFTIVSFQAMANWYHINQSFTSQFRRIQMVNGNIGYAIGEVGYLVKTTDGGNTWRGLSTQSSNGISSGSINYVDLSFVSTTVGYMVGTGGNIVKTSDGGTTWANLVVNNNAASITSVQFFSDGTGFIADVNGKVFKSTNAGVTWTLLSTNTSTQLNKMSFYNSQIGYIVGANGIVLSTIDGGTNWTLKTLGNSLNITSVFADPISQGQTAWLTTPSSVYKTTDGGTTWTVTNSSQTGINDISFYGQMTGFIACSANGNASVVFKTTDGGTTWTSVTLPTTVGGLGIYTLYYSGSTVYCGGTYMQLYKSTDNGTNWTKVNDLSPSQGDNIYGVSFTSSTQDGWAVANNGRILKSADGGETWTGQTSGVASLLVSVNAFSTQAVWACGASGVILATTNGGSAWSSQTSGVSTTLYDIKFNTASNGLCVGDQGKILKTTNGGSTWTAVTTNTTNVLRYIYYASASVVYVVGHGGIMLKSTDGGSTWSALTTGVSTNLLGVHFTSTTEGYICGASGVIKKTTDGGTNWTAQTSPVPTRYMVRILFTSATNGWAVGEAGYILRTTNAGATWKLTPSFTIQVINGIAAVSGGDLVACAQIGTHGKFKESCPTTAPVYYNTSSTTICTGTSATLTAVGQGNVSWYSAPTGGAYLGSGATFVTPNLSASTVYYAQDSTCSASSSRTAISVYVVGVTSSTPASRCGNGTVTLNANVNYGTVNWYAASTGGSSLQSGASYTPTMSTTTTYYAVSNLCPNNTRTPVVGTVYTIPTITGTTPASRCGNGSVTLNATASAGTLDWYVASTGGSSLLTGSSYATPSISSNTNYYVDATSNDGCTTASRTAVTATIKTIPTITAVYTDSACVSGAFTLSVTPSAGTVNWHVASTGGSSLATGNVYATPTLTLSTPYYVDATVNGCTTLNRTEVLAKINALPTTSVSLTDNTFSASQVGASYQWVNCGNNSLIPNETTADYTATAVGNYKVIITLNGCVDSSACQNISVLGINDIANNNQLAIYPNPSNGSFTVKGLEGGAYNIVNELGQVLETFTLTSNTSVKIENLNAGIYFLLGADQNNQQIKQKIVVAK